MLGDQRAFAFVSPTWIDRVRRTDHRIICFGDNAGEGGVAGSNSRHFPINDRGRSIQAEA